MKENRTIRKLIEIVPEDKLAKKSLGIAIVSLTEEGTMTIMRCGISEEDWYSKIVPNMLVETRIKQESMLVHVAPGIN